MCGASAVLRATRRRDFINRIGAFPGPRKLLGSARLDYHWTNTFLVLNYYDSGDTSSSLNSSPRLTPEIAKITHKTDTTLKREEN